MLNNFCYVQHVVQIYLALPNLALSALRLIRSASCVLTHLMHLCETHRCCAESGEHDALQAAVKQMLKPFKPAQDRFEGLDTERSEANDCVVLKDAASYVSCTIKDRLEAGDHWIVYATVDDGKVLAEIEPTAVHHRKIGTTY